MSKKLLIITPIFAKDKNDDTAVPFITQFLDFFSTYYPEVDLNVITLRYPFNQSTYSYGNITIYALGGGFKKTLYSLILLLKTALLTYQLHKKQKFNGVLSFWYGETMLIGRLLHMVFKIPHFTWLQGQDVKHSNRFMHWFPPKPKYLIAAGDLHNKKLKDAFGIIALKIAPISLNRNKFNTLNLNKRHIDILGVGNLGPIKNFSRFIDIIAQIKTSYPNIKAVICGEGDLKPMLQEKINELALTAQITLIGQQSNASVRALMNTTKVFLHTSKFESGPLVIHEALYSGCQVISTVGVSSKKVEGCFISDNTELIVLKLEQLLKKVIVPKRILINKIEDTAAVIYDCFFSAKS